MISVIENVYNHYATPCEVYYMAGQSNMAGRDVDGTSLTSRANDSNIFEYNRDASGVRSFAAIYPDGGSIENFGSNVGSMRTRFNQTSNKLFVIRYAVGGHCIAAFLPEAQRLIDPQTALPATNADRSQDMIDLFNESMTELYRKNFNRPVKTHFVWYQGAEDAKYDNSGQEYTQDLSALYGEHLKLLLAYVRNNISVFSGNVTIIRSPDWQSGPGGSGVKPGQDEVRGFQVSVAEEDSRANWLSSDENQSVTTTWEDSSHIDAASQERLGIDLAALI
jgi:hypothetical protein